MGDAEWIELLGLKIEEADVRVEMKEKLSIKKI